MNKPNFRKLNIMIKDISKVESDLAEIFDEVNILESTIKTACQDALFDKSIDSLAKVSVDESAIGEASENLFGSKWIQDFIMREENRYIPKRN